MPDWFSDLVAKVGGEVVGSKETHDKLALTDRVTPDSLTAAIEAAVEDLRTQLSTAVRAVETANAAKASALDDVLMRQSREVTLAQNRLDTVNALGARSAVAAGMVGVPHPLSALWRLLATLNPWRRSGVETARAGVARAEEAYRAAVERLAQDPRIQAFDHDSAEARAALSGQLHDALMLRVNEIIDHALDDSYERGFSYERPARLTDQLDAAVQAPVSIDAFREIRGHIDAIGSGAIGVAGPRGSGKSTLLSQFAVPVSINGRQRQWGVCVAAPTKYDPRDFLLYLFGQLCRTVLGEDSSRALEDSLTGTGRDGTGSGLPPGLLWCALGTVLACAAVDIALWTARPVTAPHALVDLMIAACLAVVGVALIASGQYVRGWMVMRWSPIGVSLPLSVLDFRTFSQGRSFVRTVSQGRSFVLWLSIAGAATLLGLTLAGHAPEPGYVTAVGFAVASVLALVLYLLIKSYVVGSWRVILLPEAWRMDLKPDEALDQIAATWVPAAEDWYRKVKFQQSYTTGWSGTVTLGAGSVPFQAQAGRSGSRAVTPLAMSTPEIVAAFRSFAETLGGRQLPRAVRETGGRIPVVIGIDEVDKIEDPQEAQAFFNQIKGLFNDTSCVFLISISDDAMAAFERRGLPLRDAFDSSLSRVVRLSYLSLADARKLTGSRLVGLQQPAADLLYVLSGGLPRELVRLIRRAVEADADAQKAHAEKADAQKADALKADALKADALKADALKADALKADALKAHSQENDADSRKAVEPAGEASATGPTGEAAGASPAGPTDDTNTQSRPTLGLDDLAVLLAVTEVTAQQRAVLARGRTLEPCAAREHLLRWASRRAAPVGSAAGYFAWLRTDAEQLIGACDRATSDPGTPDGARRPHADGCAATETGALLLWLATVGQVFGRCADRADFEQGESPDGNKSFERLAEARQNFPLGAAFVIDATAAVRTAWRLDREAADSQAVATTRQRVPSQKADSDR